MIEAELVRSAHWREFFIPSGFVDDDEMLRDVAGRVLSEVPALHRMAFAGCLLHQKVEEQNRHCLNLAFASISLIIDQDMLLCERKWRIFWE